MKHIAAIAVILLVSLAGTGSASAQTPKFKADVPFGFYVMNKWVPPGTYTLSADARTPNIVSIGNTANRIALFDVGYSVDKQEGPSRLVFHKYGDHYFLSAIQCSSCRMNVAFFRSSQEKEEQTREAANRAPKNIYLALK